MCEFLVSRTPTPSPKGLEAAREQAGGVIPAAEKLVGLRAVHWKVTLETIERESGCVRLEDVS